MKQPFKKNERLSRFQLIRKLFREGSTLHVPAFRMTWLIVETFDNPLPQVMFSVPKHHFHTAVDRNLIRRRMRECYRLNKQLLNPSLPPKPSSLLICITYMAKEILPFSDIQAKIILLLQRLTEVNEKLTR